MFAQGQIKGNGAREQPGKVACRASGVAVMRHLREHEHIRTADIDDCQTEYDLASGHHQTTIVMKANTKARKT